MEKVFKVADIRDLEQKVALGEISYSRMVEMLNEKAEEHYSKVKKLNEPAVSKCDSIEREALLLAYEKWKDTDDKAYGSNECNIKRFLSQQ